MRVFNIIFFLLISLINSDKSYAEKVSIVYTVDNIPITSVEINNEIIYLKLINKNLKEMDDENLVVYASKSILRERIKELEISKYFKFGFNEELVFQNLENLISSLGFSNEDDFNKFLLNSNLSKEFIKKKIEIELLWNRLIYEKYKNKLSINNDKIKKNLKLKIDKEDNQIEEYKLSEILFSPTSKSTEKDEIDKIRNSINEVGFENTAIIYSLSNTASSGGEIGWLKKTQLSENIIQIIQNLDIGEITNPIDAPAGKLILILKDKRKVKKEISFEKEFEKAILFEKNKQLNQFSSIYFKKVELDTKINER